MEGIAVEAAAAAGGGMGDLVVALVAAFGAPVDEEEAAAAAIRAVHLSVDKRNCVASPLGWRDKNLKRTATTGRGPPGTAQSALYKKFSRVVVVVVVPVVVVADADGIPLTVVKYASLPFGAV